MKKKTYRKILMYAAILAATICFVFPIYWMLLTSLKPNEAILRLPPQFLPVNATLANYHTGDADAGSASSLCIFPVPV